MIDDYVPRPLTDEHVSTQAVFHTDYYHSSSTSLVSTPQMRAPTKDGPVPSRRVPKSQTEYVALTPPVRESLHTRRQRTGRGTHSLLSNMPEVPDRLTLRLITTWLHVRCISVPSGHIDYVRELWRRLRTRR